MTLCPCNPNSDFSNCCEPYLNHVRLAETPEILMRSRYSAYSRADIQYIQKTMCKKAIVNFNAENARAWASSVTWLGLTIIDASPIFENTGTVTFFARFSENGKNKFIYEKSIFEKINDAWFYVDGVTPKINRNDNCPCGTGKKFKRCCGK